MIQHRITYRNSVINQEENIIVNFCDGNPEESNAIVEEMKTVVNELKAEVPAQQEADMSELDVDELLNDMDVSELFDPSEFEAIKKEIKDSET